MKKYVYKVQHDVQSAFTEFSRQQSSSPVSVSRRCTGFVGKADCSQLKWKWKDFTVSTGQACSKMGSEGLASTRGPLQAPLFWQHWARHLHLIWAWWLCLMRKLQVCWTGDWRLSGGCTGRIAEEKVHSPDALKIWDMPAQSHMLPSVRQEVQVGAGTISWGVRPAAEAGWLYSKEVHMRVSDRFEMIQYQKLKCLHEYRPQSNSH